MVRFIREFIGNLMAGIYFGFMCFSLLAGLLLFATPFFAAVKTCNPIWLLLYLIHIGIISFMDSRK